MFAPFKRLFISLCLLLAASTVGEEQEQNDKDFQAARKDHEELFKRPISNDDPNFWKKNRVGGLCTYKGFCSYFSKNALKPWLHEGLGGFKIPNTHFLQIDETLAACLGAKKAAFNERVDSEEAEAYKKFYDSLDKGERKRYAQFYSWAQDNPPDPIVDEYKETSLGEGIETLSEFAQEKGMEVFDPESREAYLSYLLDVEQKVKHEAAPLPEWESFNEDYLLNPRLYEKSSNPPDFKDHTDRVTGLFKSVQSSLIALVKERRTNRNKAAIDAMIVRLENVKFAVPAPGSPLPSSCDSPNGYFSRQTFTIVVCPQYLRMPEQTVRQMLGHEMGHVIDPCESTCPLCHETNDGRSSQEAIVKQSPPKAVSDLYLSFNFPSMVILSEKDPQKLQSSSASMHFRNEGPTMAEGEKVIAFSERNKDYPFKQTLDCLEGVQSVKARKQDTAKISERLGQTYQTLLRSGANPQAVAATDLRERKNLAAKNFPEKSACNWLAGDLGGPFADMANDQRAEAFADWVAKELTRRHFKNKVPSVNADGSQTGPALEMLAGFAGGCAEIEETVNFYMERLAKRLKCESYAPSARELGKQKMMSHVDSHPADVDRFERIFLASPDIARSLGCPVTPNTKDCP